MNGTLVTAILGGILGDTLALLALTLSTSFTFSVTSAHRLPTKRQMRATALFAVALGLIEATIWSLTFHNAYDAPGSWCWTCSLILDALGETTENMLTMLLLGSTAGLSLGLVYRYTIRRWLTQRWYRRVYLNSDHWRRLRHAWWERHPHASCIKCWTPATEHHADLHHLTYARIGHERDTDLAPIHRSCHIEQHGH